MNNPKSEQLITLLEHQRLLSACSQCPNMVRPVITGSTVAYPIMSVGQAPGSREGEFADRINGLSYEEIAERGGGILNSAQRLQKTSESELVEQALRRIQEVRGFGTGLIEIKSGYGLTVESESNMLRVINKLKIKYSFRT